MKIILTENQFNKLILEAVLSLDEIYDKYYSKIPRDIFNKIIASDPTYNAVKGDKMGKYGKWLLSLWLNRKMQLEDLYKANEYLSYFIKYYNVIQVKDINKYKSLQDLYNVVSQYITNDGEIATSKSDEVRRIKEGAEKVYEDNQWLVIIPHTQEASCYYGKGTQWCTAAEKSYNAFNSYNDQGPLYINIDKMNDAKYQFHFETDSFMDENDTPIESPIAEEIGLSSGLCEWYRNNVEEANKLFEIAIEFYYSDATGSEFVLIQDENNDTVYRLYNKSDSENVCGGLICSDGIEEMRRWYKQLYKTHYCIVPNVKEMYTLLVIDDGDLYAMLDNAVNIEGLKNDWSDMDDEFMFFDVTYDDGRRCILQNNGTHQYQCKDGSMVSYIDFISYDNIGIYKKDGSCDVLNWNYEQIFYNLRDVEVDYDEDDTIYAYNKDGQRVKINTYSGDEEIAENDSDDEYEE